MTSPPVNLTLEDLHPHHHSVPAAQGDQTPSQQLNMSDYTTYHDIQHIIRTQVTPIICALGCFGNLLNLAVLLAMKTGPPGRPKDAGVQLGLVILAVSDMMFCVTMIPRGFVSETQSMFTSYNFMLIYQVYGTGLVTTFILISTWLTVAMGVMRYIAICHPFKSRMLNKRVYAKLTYVFTCIACLAFNLPSFMHYKILSLNLDGQTVLLIDIGYMDQDQFRGRLFVWIKVTFGVIIPVAIMIFCNCSLIHALRKSYRMRTRSHVVQDGGSGRGTTITLTLIIIIIVFVLFVFPSEMMDFSSDFLQGNQESDSSIELFLMFRSFTNVLQVVNFSFNFILYCIINVHFRKTFISLMTCGRYPKSVRQGMNPSRYGNSSTMMTLIQPTHAKHKDGDHVAMSLMTNGKGGH